MEAPVDEADAWLGLGDTYMKTGAINEAIKAYQKDKKQYQDPTVEFFVLAASKAESLEPSFWKK